MQFSQSASSSWTRSSAAVCPWVPSSVPPERLEEMVRSTTRNWSAVGSHSSLEIRMAQGPRWETRVRFENTPARLWNSLTSPSPRKRRPKCPLPPGKCLNIGETWFLTKPFTCDLARSSVWWWGPDRHLTATTPLSSACAPPACLAEGELCFGLCQGLSPAVPTQVPTLARVAVGIQTHEWSHG